MHHSHHCQNKYACGRNSRQKFLILTQCGCGFPRRVAGNKHGLACIQTVLIRIIDKENLFQKNNVNIFYLVLATIENLRWREGSIFIEFGAHSPLQSDVYWRSWRKRNQSGMERNSLTVDSLLPIWSCRNRVGSDQFWWWGQEREDWRFHSNIHKWNVTEHP